MKIRAALVGVGGYGQIHFEALKALAETGEIELAAVADSNPENLRNSADDLKALGSSVYSGLDELLASHTEPLDWVCLPVGIPYHAPLTRQALAHRANVLVEKPAAGSVEEVRSMMRAEAESGGKFVAVGFQHLYVPEIRNLKTRLITGEFGAVQRIVAMGLWPRANAYYRRNHWVCRLHGPHGEPIYDSPINNAFAHYLNLALFLAGPTAEASAHAVTMQAELYRARPEIETFDSCGVRLHTVENIEIVALFSHATFETIHPSLRVECERARIDWNADDGIRIAFPDGRASERTSPMPPVPEMFRRICARIRGKEELICPLSIALEHTFCIERLHQYFKPVELPRKFVAVREEDGQFSIDSIGLCFRRGYAEGKLPSELNLPWGISVPEVPLEGKSE